MPQRGVERGGEAEGDAGLGADPADVGGRQVEPDAELLEHVGTAGLARGGAVAVLDHVTPAPAATIAAIVEMFTEKERSPPVPTTSRTRPGTESGVACAYIASTRPCSSSTVSPLARRATAKPAICTAVASPERIWSIAHEVCPASRSVPATSPVRTSGQV